MAVLRQKIMWRTFGRGLPSDPSPLYEYIPFYSLGMKEPWPTVNDLQMEIRECEAENSKEYEDSIVSGIKN